MIDRAAGTVGHVVTAQTVLVEAPLNGRHFTHLGLLVPGSVAPSQTGFSTTPSRGNGVLVILRRPADSRYDVLLRHLRRTKTATRSRHEQSRARR